MADVNEMFNQVTGEQSYFNPHKKKDFKPVSRGEYFGHIIEAKTQILDVKGGKYKARLYSYTVEAAEENKDKEFTFYNKEGQPETTKGDTYVGMKFRGKLWRFLEPQKDDTFESYAEGNKAYLKFCENLDIDCPTEKKKIDGKDVEVNLLPSISTEDILGQPVIAFVDKGRPYTDKNGKTRQYHDCKFCKKWEGGKKKTITGGGKDEIPF